MNTTTEVEAKLAALRTKRDEHEIAFQALGALMMDLPEITRDLALQRGDTRLDADRVYKRVLEVRREVSAAGAAYQAGLESLIKRLKQEIAGGA